MQPTNNSPYVELNQPHSARIATKSLQSKSQRPHVRRLQTLEKQIFLMTFAEQNFQDNDTCRDIHQEALVSHAECYQDTGFCDLPLSDWLKILTTIDPTDIDLKTTILTSVKCLSNFSQDNPSVIENE